MRNRADIDREGAADWRTWEVDGARVADIGRAQAELDMIEARQAELLGRLQSDAVAAHRDGASSGPLEWRVAGLCADVACELRLSERVVQRLMNLGMQLVDDLPFTLQAWREGMITRRHVEAIAGQLTGLDAHARGECEMRLLDAAVEDQLTPAELKSLGRRLREQLSEQSPHERHVAARGERHVTLEPADDGMAWLSVLMSAVDAAACYDRIRAISSGVNRGAAHAGEVAHADEEVGTSFSPAAQTTGVLRREAEPRTLSQLHTDVLRDLLIHGVVPGMESPAADEFCEASAASGASSMRGVAVCDSGLGSGIVARVTVTVPALALLDSSADAEIRDRQRRSSQCRSSQCPSPQCSSPRRSARAHAVAELEGIGPVSVEAARGLISETSILHRMITDPVSGAALALDRTRYRPTRELAEYVKTRDGTCRFPGCRRAAHHCEVDHTINWEWDGPTNPDNLACLCRRHHVMKHQSDWIVKHVGGASLHWTSPTGAAHVTHPRSHA